MRPKDFFGKRAQFLTFLERRLDKLEKNVFLNTLSQHRLNAIDRQEQFYAINLSSQELDADQTRAPLFVQFPGTSTERNY